MKIVGYQIFSRITRFVILVFRPDYQKFCLRSTPDSRTPLLQLPSKSDWSGRKTGVVVHEGLNYFITWTLARAYLHTDSFVNTVNIFRSALQNAGKRSDISATASSGTPALSLFNTEQRRPSLAAFSNNNAVFFLDQSTQHFDIGPYKTTFRKHGSNIGSHIYVACLTATFVLSFATD